MSGTIHAFFNRSISFLLILLFSFQPIATAAAVADQANAVADAAQANLADRVSNLRAGFDSADLAANKVELIAQMNAVDSKHQAIKDRQADLRDLRQQTQRGSDKRQEIKDQLAAIRTDKQQLRQDYRTLKSDLRETNRQIARDFRNYLRDNLSRKDFKKARDLGLTEPDLLYMLEGTVTSDTLATDQWELSAYTDDYAAHAAAANTANQSIVAVIDSGVDYTHPELAGNLVDLTTCVDAGGVAISGGCPFGGWDFVHNDNNPYPTDASNHGTAVAGLIAATTDNNAGIATLAANTAQIMPLRVANNGLILASDIAEAIRFATNNGADVINLSLGGPDYSQIVADAVTYAETNGVVIVAAAGNQGVDYSVEANYPAALPNDNVIAVGATESDGTLAAFSNYSNTLVDIAAPGVGLQSLVVGDSYGEVTGTSFAAPVVSALFAYWLAEDGSIDEDIDGLDVGEDLTGLIVGEKTIVNYPTDPVATPVPAVDPEDEQFFIADLEEHADWLFYQMSVATTTGEKAILRVNHEIILSELDFFKAQTVEERDEIRARIYELRKSVGQLPNTGITLSDLSDYPFPVSPGDNVESGPEISSNTSRLDLKGDYVRGAGYYDFYISKYPYGESNIVAEQSSYSYISGDFVRSRFDNPSDFDTPLAPGTKYRWNYRACYDAARTNCKYASTRRYFHTESISGVNSAPSVPSISGGSSGNVGDTKSYTFNSTDADGDNITYQIKWDANNSSSKDNRGAYTQGQDITFSHRFTKSQTYCIKARAYDGDDYSSWSGCKNVVIGGGGGGGGSTNLEKAELDSPGRITYPGTLEDASKELVFDWDSVRDRDYYTIAISKNPYGPGNVIFDDTGFQLSRYNLPANTLQPGTEYRWDVQACDSSGCSFSDNFYFETKQLLPLPDLQATNLTVPASAISGQTISVSYTITNNSIYNANGDFVVKMALSNNNDISIVYDSIFDTETINGLAAGQSHTVNKTVALPPSTDSEYDLNQTQYRIGLLVDENDEIAESIEANNSNNDFGVDRAYIDIAVTDPNAPDLVGQTFDLVDDSVNQGDNTGVNLVIKNQGNSDATTDFDVQLYLSQNSTINPSVDHFLKTFTVTDTIPAGGTYSRYEAISLPAVDDDAYDGGRLYSIGMVIDSADSIVEDSETNNYDLQDGADKEKLDIIAAVAATPRERNQTGVGSQNSKAVEFQSLNPTIDVYTITHPDHDPNLHTVQDDPKGADPINLRTGGFELTQVDFRAAGGLLPLDFARVYNSKQGTVDGRFGHGWSFSYHSYYYQHPDNGEITVYRGGPLGSKFIPGEGGHYQVTDDSSDQLYWNGTDLVLESLSGIKYTFGLHQSDNLGVLTSISDRYGNTSTIDYNTVNEVFLPHTITDGSGRQIALVYGDSAGQHWDKIVQLNLVGDSSYYVTYSYDSYNNLTSYTAHNGGTTRTESFTYNDLNYMATYTDARGTVLHNTNDETGRVVAQYEYNPSYDNNPAAPRHVYDLAYDIAVGSSTCTSVTSYNNTTGATTTNAVEQLCFENDLQVSKSTGDMQLIYSRNELGLVESVADASGDVTQYLYDSRRRVVGEILPDTATAQTRIVRTYEDNWNQVTSETVYATSTILTGDVAVRTTTNTIDPATGHVLSTTNAAGETTSYTYNSSGQVLTVTNPLGDETTYTYDTDGNLVSESRRQTAVSGFSKIATVSHSYDQWGRRVSTTDPLGNVTSYAYDARGNRTSMTDPAGNTTTYVYDSEDHLIETINPDGTKTVAVYDTSLEAQVTQTALYDSSGTMLRSNAASYDPTGKQTSATTVLGAGTQTYYDLAGRLASSTDADGISTYYHYTVDGQLASTTDTTGARVEYTYDARGNRTSVKTYTSATDFLYQQYIYDGFGQLAVYIDAEGNRTDYSYDDAGRKVSETDALGNTTSYSYDAVGNMTSVTDTEGNNTLYTHDEAGNVLTETLPDGTILTNQYDLAGQLITTVKTNDPNTSISTTGENTHSGRVYTNHGWHTTNNFTALGGASEMTLETWVKTSTDNPTGFIVAVNDGGYETFQLMKNGSSYVFMIRTDNGVAGSAGIDETLVEDGDWHHLAAVYTGSEIRIYLDGVQHGVDHYTSGQIFAGGVTKLGIGARRTPANISQGWLSDMMVDEVRIWNVARSQSDITNTKSLEFEGTEPGLVGYWQMNNDGVDATGGNDLVTVGSPIFEQDTGFITTPAVDNEEHSISYSYDSRGNLVSQTEQYVTLGTTTAASSTTGTSSNWGLVPGVYNYKKAINLTGASGAGTDYQVLLKIAADSGVSGADFHLHGNSHSFPTTRNDGGDLAFYDDTETTALPFWVEKVENGLAHVWVKVADDLSANQTIYVYYGHDSATNYSDGDDTFELFDEFEGGTVDTTKWSNVVGTVSVSGGQMTIGDSVSDHDYVDSAASFGVGHKVRWYGQINYEGWTTPRDGFVDPSIGESMTFRSRWDNLPVKTVANVSESGTSVQKGHTGLWEIRRMSDGSGQFFIDEVQEPAAATTWSGNAQIRFHAGTGQDIIDYMFVAKHNDVEPSFDTSGIEESLAMVHPKYASLATASGTDLGTPAELEENIAEVEQEVVEETSTSTTTSTQTTSTAGQQSVTTGSSSEPTASSSEPVVIENNNGTSSQTVVLPAPLYKPAQAPARGYRYAERLWRLQGKISEQQAKALELQAKMDQRDQTLATLQARLAKRSERIATIKDQIKKREAAGKSTSNQRDKINRIQEKADRLHTRIATVTERQIKLSERLQNVGGRIDRLTARQLHIETRAQKSQRVAPVLSPLQTTTSTDSQATSEPVSIIGHWISTAWYYTTDFVSSLFTIEPAYANNSIITEYVLDETIAEDAVVRGWDIYRTGDEEILNAGGYGAESNVLIKFDTTAMPAEVQTAELHVYLTNTTWKRLAGITVGRASANWDETTVTWANAPTDLDHFGQAPGLQTGGWYSIDITDYYNAWQAGDYENHGIRISPNSTSQENNAFCSSECTTTTQLPKLVLTTADPNASSQEPNSHSVHITTNNGFHTPNTFTALDGAGAMTVEAWVKTSVDNPTGFVAAVNDGGAATFQLMKNGNDYVFMVRTQSNRYDSDAIFETLVEDGQWHHLAGVYDGSNVRIYLDGVQQGSDNAASGAVTTNFPTALAIGHRRLPNGTSETFFSDMKIDEVRLWNIARTETEINDNMAIELVGDETGLVANWQLDGNGLDITVDAHDLVTVGTPSFADEGAFAGETEEPTETPVNNEPVQVTQTVTTTYAYDNMNRKVSEETSDNSATSSAYTYTYDDAGNRTSMTDALGNTTTYEYDVAGNVTKTTLPSGKYQSRTYDSMGRLLSVIENDGTISATYTYTDSRLATETDGRGNVTSYTYDLAGRLLSTTNPQGTVMTHSYDDNSNIVSTTIANASTSRTTSYTYDSRNNQTSITHPDGRVEQYGYDSSNRQVSYTAPNGDITNTAYDAAGRVNTVTYADSTTDNYSYDASGSLAELVVGDSKAVYTYDSAGNVLSKSDYLHKDDTAPVATENYIYDEQGRLAQKLLANGALLDYAYDAVGNRSSVTLTQTDGTETVLATYAYNADNLETSMTFGNGVETTKSYDARNRVNSIDTDSGSTDLFDATYTYDQNNNRTQDVTNGVTTNYTYDSLDQLITAGSDSYTYNVFGDRLTDGSSSYSYNAGGQLTSKNTGGTVTNYAYDANGALLSETTGANVINYTWNARKQLSSRDGDAYTYDSTGRNSKTVGGVTDYYVNNGLTVAYELDANKDISKIIVDDIAEIDATGNITYVHRDVLGSAVVLTDENGDEVGDYTYGEFGDTSHSGSVATNYQYTNQENDGDLYYYNGRYYNPSIGRFISTDINLSSDVLDFNRYIYVRNNPFRYTDPTGWKADEDKGGWLSSGAASDTSFDTWLNNGMNAQAQAFGYDSYEEFQNSTLYLNDQMNWAIDDPVGGSAAAMLASLLALLALPEFLTATGYKVVAVSQPYIQAAGASATVTIASTQAGVHRFVVTVTPYLQSSWNYARKPIYTITIKDLPAIIGSVAGPAMRYQNDMLDNGKRDDPLWKYAASSVTTAVGAYLLSPLGTIPSIAGNVGLSIAENALIDQKIDVVDNLETMSASTLTQLVIQSTPMKAVSQTAQIFGSFADPIFKAGLKWLNSAF